MTAKKGETTEKQAFRARPDLTLLDAWYAANRRDLPWRADPTPYHVWISEIMLQQTRVEAVRGYYRRFLEAFPDAGALARAEEDAVLKLWEGLGYYSRARNLRRAAIEITEKLGGAFPQTADELGKLPGIGPYTAAAIASIAFGEPEPAVDGNLLRVYARLNACADDILLPKTKKDAAAFFRTMMQTKETDGAAGAEASGASGASSTSGAQNAGPCRPDSRPSEHPGALNQALMDLGAGICLPGGAPLCEACPWAGCCAAHLDAEAGRKEAALLPANDPDEEAGGTEPGAADPQPFRNEWDYPVRKKGKDRKVEDLTILVIHFNGGVLLKKRPARGLLAGLIEFPNLPGHRPRAEVLRYAEDLGFHAVRIRALPEAKHIFTHKEWHMTGWEIFADAWTEFDRREPGPAAVPAAPAARGAAAGADAPGPGLFLASREEIDARWSIPSAFAVYRQAATGEDIRK